MEEFHEFDNIFTGTRPEIDEVMLGPCGWLLYMLLRWAITVHLPFRVPPLLKRLMVALEY